MNYLITYDISNNKKRTQVEKLLSSYGIRVNYSVFELTIKKQTLSTLINDLKEHMDRNDSIRVYAFNKDTIAKSLELNPKLNNPFELGNCYVEW